MATRITKKQRAFAHKYMETGNGRQSALAVYDTTDPNTAGMIASENLTKPNVREYLESKAEVAASIVFNLATSGESDNVRLAASKDILDRAGYSPVNKSESLSVSMSAKELEESMTRDIARYKGSTKP